jgi:hypothetical protein
MQFQGNVTATPRYVRQAYRAVTRRIAVVSRTIGLLSLALFVVDREVALLVSGLGCLVYLELGGWLRARAAGSRRCEMTVSITDAGYEVSDPYCTVRRDWSEVKSVRRSNDIWVLQLDGSMRCPIPATAFDPATAAQIEAFFQARGLMGRLRPAPVSFVPPNGPSSMPTAPPTI